ncbi:MAG TPA: hypothetical protein DDW52_17040, partial [Planctomycetaceae bacterium]|nr:hypothetical protein [Planctomycetaceae bacterium]
TEQANVTAEMLQEVLDLDKIVVADAIKNTNNIAKPASIASLFPEDQVFIGRTASSGDFKDPCIGRLFHWGGDGSRIQGEKLIGVVEQYEEPQTRKQIIRVRHETDPHLLYIEMGELLTGVR